MDTVRLYKNPDPYPYFSNNLTLYKTINNVKPINKNVRSGYIDCQLTFDDILSFNYLAFTREGRTVYAWVTDVELISGNKLYRIHYNIDAFRTYKNDIVLGVQHVVRSPTPTQLYDPFLSSTQHYNNYSVQVYTLGNPLYRYLIVQKRVDPDEVQSGHPGQPSPYKLYAIRYNVNNWRATQPLVEFMDYISGQYAKTSNIVTIYSVPYINYEAFNTVQLTVRVGDDGSKMIDGWKLISGSPINPENFTIKSPALSIPSDITKSRHNISVLIPDAGIINIPDEIALKGDIYLKAFVDIFSGATNYMIVDSNDNPTHLSVRSGGLPNIPILSDPYETYISQNQNTLAVSLLQDVANLGIGVMSGNPMSLFTGATSLINRFASLSDAQNTIPSNPPAFLGSALLPHFNNQFFLIINRQPYDNETQVRNRFGYPCNRIQQLTIPSSGYIQTTNCNVSSNGNVPLWAIQEINQLFDNGILFK